MTRAYFMGFIVWVLAFSTHAQIRCSWAEKKDFKWNDFTGFPDRECTYAATVNTGLSQLFQIDQNGQLVPGSSRITAYFYPRLSWYKPDQVNDGLLRHEQLHFDITELHARMFRNIIRRFKFTTNAREEIRQIFQKIELKRQKMQAAFDNQTEHGFNSKQEQRWEAKVERLLAE